METESPKKGRTGKGRPKGSKNKLTINVKTAILDVWAKLERNNRGF